MNGLSFDKGRWGPDILAVEASGIRRPH
jgi:hypothetical protein